MATKLRETLPARGLLRRALRAPIWLYRARLGGLLGHSFLLLTHRGRKSGLPRQTVLEVLRYDRPTGTHIVAAGWGPTSDWFRNIQQTPQVIVRAGGRRVAARAEVLPPDAAARELRWYATHHPIRARGLGRLITGRPFRGAEADIQRFATAIPLVALCPR
jgi:deazaflavin-dependent oxidoreductase (nitroreductase family)